MNRPRTGPSWAASLLGFALAVLAAALVLNFAAHVVIAVWPVLVGLLLVIAAGVVGYRLLHYRDHW